MSQLPPATLEGWYALHQMFGIDWSALSTMSSDERETLASETRDLLSELAAPSEPGWSGAFQLIGGGSDLMVIHFRDSLDALGAVELELRRSRVGPLLRLDYDYLSVTETGLYHATAQAAEAAEPRSEEYERLLREMADAERESPHIRTRLYPEPPAEMRYACFYPMNKRRAHPDNWYSLPVARARNVRPPLCRQDLSGHHRVRRLR